MGTPRDYNATVETMDRNVTCGYGRIIAFIDPSTTLTYGQLQSEALKVTNPLTELNIGHEAHVAVLMLDTVEYPRWIVAVDDLPKTATGKIQRSRLRDQVDGGAP
jgi:acyl-coenzyme A synthetase/AMP-(fatty) acid ligase